MVHPERLRPDGRCVATPLPGRSPAIFLPAKLVFALVTVIVMAHGHLGN